MIRLQFTIPNSDLPPAELPALSEDDVDEFTTKLSEIYEHYEACGSSQELCDRLVVSARFPFQEESPVWKLVISFIVAVKTNDNSCSRLLTFREAYSDAMMFYCSLDPHSLYRLCVALEPKTRRTGPRGDKLFFYRSTSAVRTRPEEEASMLRREFIRFVELLDSTQDPHRHVRFLKNLQTEINAVEYGSDEWKFWISSYIIAHSQQNGSDLDWLLSGDVWIEIDTIYEHLSDDTLYHLFIGIEDLEVNWRTFDGKPIVL